MNGHIAAMYLVVGKEASASVWLKDKRSVELKGALARGLASTCVRVWRSVAGARGVALAKAVKTAKVKMVRIAYKVGLRLKFTFIMINQKLRRLLKPQIFLI